MSTPPRWGGSLHGLSVATLGYPTTFCIDVTDSNSGCNWWVKGGFALFSVFQLFSFSGAR